MNLKEILQNSNYVTDEELQDNMLLGMSNNCIAEVNAQCGTLLPFFKEEYLENGDAYNAIPAVWVLRLVEPYLSYAIAANDGDTDARDFHYNRFLKALEQFKTNGLHTITSSEYEGQANSVRAIDVSDRTFHWNGWC